VLSEFFIDLVLPVLGGWFNL